MSEGRGETYRENLVSHCTLFSIIRHTSFTAGPGQGNLSAIESMVTASQKAYQHGVEGESAEYRDDGER